MDMNAAQSPLVATGAPLENEYAFKQLCAHLPLELKHITDDLDTVSRDLDAHGAHASAARLRRLDNYATVLPPESLPGLLDSDAAREELEEAISANSRYPWLRYSWLVAMRNLLALVPLLITWYSLSLATRAYQAEVNQHPNLVYQPFLILWENGFDHRLSLTFSAVAGIDTFLFIVLIVVTGGIHWLERKSQVEANQLVTRMDQSVIHLVFALGQSRMAFSDNPTDWAAAVQKVIAEAMKLTRQQAKENQAATQIAVASAQIAADAVNASRVGIDGIAEQTREYIRQVKGEFAETVNLLREENQSFLTGLQRETNERLTFAFEEASKQMRGQFEATSQQISDDIKRVTQASYEAVERSQEAIVQVRQESTDALAQINAENKQFLADANKDSLAMLVGAAEKIDQIAERLRVSVESLQSAIEQHKDGASALVDSMSKIGEVTQHFGSSMQTFTSTAATMDAHVQEIAQAHERFTQRVETMATSLTSAAGETQTATQDMQAAAAQMTDALSYANAMSSDVVRAGQQWAQVQSSLPTVMQAMHEAADNLRNLRVQVQVALPKFGSWFGKRAA